MVAEVVVAGQALSCFVGFVSGENRTLHIDLSMFVECCRDLSGLSYNAVSARERHRTAATYLGLTELMDTFRTA